VFNIADFQVGAACGHQALARAPSQGHDTQRWQYCGKRRVSIDELRVVMGTVELTPKGNISKTLLALYKDFKKRALLPAVTEINQKTDISVSFVENKIPGAKAVESLTLHLQRERQRVEA
jgi:plasmid replication initiation protein